MLFFSFFHIRCCARYITLREVNRYWIELIGLFGSDYNGRDGREREREPNLWDKRNRNNSNRDMVFEVASSVHSNESLGP